MNAKKLAAVVGASAAIAGGALALGVTAAEPEAPTIVSDPISTTDITPPYPTDPGGPASITPTTTTEAEG